MSTKPSKTLTINTIHKKGWTTYEISISHYTPKSLLPLTYQVIEEQISETLHDKDRIKEKKDITLISPIT